MKTRFRLTDRYLDHWEETAPGIRDRLKDYAEDIAACEIRRKARSSTPTVEAGERATVQVISTRDVDRDGEIMVPGGALLDEYKANPVVMWAHDYSMPPIARTTELRVEPDKITAKAVYSETPFADDIYRLKQEGIQTAVSVGFLTLQSVLNGGPGWKETTDRLSDEWGVKPKAFSEVNAIHTKWLMLEYSDVPIPANPNAVTIATSLNLSDETLERLGFAEDEQAGTVRRIGVRAVTPVLSPVIRRPQVKFYSFPTTQQLVAEEIRRRQGVL